MRVVVTGVLALLFVGGASTAQAQLPPICQQNALLCQTFLQNCRAL